MGRLDLSRRKTTFVNLRRTLWLSATFSLDAETRVFLKKCLSSPFMVAADPFSKIDVKQRKGRWRKKMGGRIQLNKIPHEAKKIVVTPSTRDLLTTTRSAWSSATIPVSANEEVKNTAKKSWATRRKAFFTYMVLISQTRVCCVVMLTPLMIVLKIYLSVFFWWANILTWWWQGGDRRHAPLLRVFWGVDLSHHPLASPGWHSFAYLLVIRATRDTWPFLSFSIRYSSTTRVLV